MSSIARVASSSRQEPGTLTPVPADGSSPDRDPSATTDRGLRRRILVVEDEPSLATLLCYNLEAEGYNVTALENGRMALEAILAEPPDLVLLDWMIPGLSGLEMCCRVRRDIAPTQMPIIMLTARGDEGSRISGLKNGADDYLTKPFSMAELMARVRTVLRRINESTTDRLLAVGDLVLDGRQYRATRGGRQLELGPTEYRLLKHLMERPGRVSSRDNLRRSVLGENKHVGARTVDVHIWRLRTALNANGEPDLIRTVRSAGYALEAPQIAAPHSDDTA